MITGKHLMMYITHIAKNTIYAHTLTGDDHKCDIIRSKKINI